MTLELLILFLLIFSFGGMLYVYFILKHIIKDLTDVQTYMDDILNPRNLNNASSLKKVRDPEEKPIGVRTNSGQYIPVFSHYPEIDPEDKHDVKKYW